jgi:O-methyltransferase involved in polyketide biosynthesis
VVGAALPWTFIDGHWAGPRGTVAVRTRYIDDLLEEALRSGVGVARSVLECLYSIT